MPSTPGRPISPTLHPRTKGPAEDIAKKLKTTSDWFRHDGKNIQNSPPPPVRLHHQQALDAAEKNKCKADQWFEHHSETVNNGEHVMKRTQEAGKNSDKIKGVQEKWYKHDDNQSYNAPIITHKVLSGESATEAKDKIGNAETMEWYRHEHKKNGVHDFRDSPPQKGKGRNPTNNMRPDGTPSWAVYQMKDSGPKRLLHGKAKGGGDYLERNRDGSDWFDHDAAPPIGGESITPRCTTAEGAEIAIKNRAESANWYDHANCPGQPDEIVHHKGQSDATREMVQRSRGGAMEYVMRQPTNTSNQDFCSEKDERGGTPLPPAPEPRVTGEVAQTIHKKNINGMMNQFIRQDLNSDYHSARAAPRLRNSQARGSGVKGRDGVMAHCLTGYPGSPAAAHSNQPLRGPGRAVKPEAGDNANRGKGTLQKVISSPDTLPCTDRPGQRVKPEAAQYAERNKGTLGRSMNMDGSGEVRPSSRAGNEMAQSLALRNRGTMGNIIFGGN